MPIDMYLCRSCLHPFNTREEAETCEAIPVEGKEFPIGYQFQLRRSWDTNAVYTVIGNHHAHLINIKGKRRHIRRYLVQKEGENKPSIFTSKAIEERSVAI